MITLYDNLSSGNAYKVRLLLALKGLAFRRIEMNIDRAETRTREFLAKNPNGRVPLLELEDGRRLAESNAIIAYLAEGTPWMPADPWERALVLQWLFFEQYSHEPNIATLRYWITHGIEMTEARQIAAEQKRPLGHAALAVMEEHLATRRFFVGERFTIADVALYAYTHVAPEGGFDLAPYAAVRAWIDRVAGLPGHVPIDWTGS
jgi:glutathione S-transferase